MIEKAVVRSAVRSSKASDGPSALVGGPDLLGIMIKDCYCCSLQALDQHMLS